MASQLKGCSVLNVEAIRESPLHLRLHVKDCVSPGVVWCNFRESSLVPIS